MSKKTICLYHSILSIILLLVFCSCSDRIPVTFKTYERTGHLKEGPEIYGADIYIDGELTNFKTPATLKLSRGSYTVRFVHSDYEDSYNLFVIPKKNKSWSIFGHLVDKYRWQTLGEVHYSYYSLGEYVPLLSGSSTLSKRLTRSGEYEYSLGIYENGSDRDMLVLGDYYINGHHYNACTQSSDYNWESGTFLNINY